MGYGGGGAGLPGGKQPWPDRELAGKGAAINRCPRSRWGDFYLAYRWVAGNRARLVGYAEASFSYPPVVRLRGRCDTNCGGCYVA